MIDAHLHLWDPTRLSYDWLEGQLDEIYDARRYTDLLQSRGRDDTAAIAVQADCRPHQCLGEVEWLTSIADQANLSGIVAFAPLDMGNKIEDYLDELQQSPLVVGVRYLLQDRPSEQWLSTAALSAARAIARRGLTFDACVRHTQLDDLITFVDQVPELRVVLDHLGKPAVGSVPDGGWETVIRRLADRPSVAAKLSGLPAAAKDGWSEQLVRPYLNAAWESFGAERLMFGSDWPVSGAGSNHEYWRWRDAVQEWVISCGDAALAAGVSGETARRWYRIPGDLSDGNYTSDVTDAQRREVAQNDPFDT